MNERTGVVTGRHIRIENGVVYPTEGAFSWWISPNLKDIKLEKGDIIRVDAFGGVPLVVVEEVFPELPEGMKSPHKSTIEFFAKVPPPGMNWPPNDEEYRKKQKAIERKRRRKELNKPVNPRSFRERLKYLLEYYSMGHQKVSELTGLGTTNAHIRKWAKGIDMPSPERVQGLAKALDVSPQWLAGEEDKPLAFNDKLRQKLFDGKWGKKKFEKATGIPRTEIFLFAVGASVPTIKQLRKIAEVLDVSPQWLAGNQ